MAMDPMKDDVLDEMVLSDVLTHDSTALLSDHAPPADFGMDLSAGVSAVPGHGLPMSSSASSAAADPALNGPCACFSVAFYKPYFDVDLDHVVARLKSALLFCPASGTPFLQLIDGRPDAYGPFWLATTLVFAIAVTSHLGALFAFDGEKGDEFEYDFEVVTTCASVVYGYLFLVPLGFWTAFKYWLNVPLPLIHVLCVVGYSLAPYLPLSTLCIVPLAWLQWIALLAACVLSTLFVIKALMPTLMQHVPQQTVMVLGVFMLANVALMLSVKFGCYSD